MLMADERFEVDLVLDKGVGDTTANVDPDTDCAVQDALRRVIEKLQHLSPDNQRRVLDTARTFYRLDPTHTLPGIGAPR